MLKLGFKLSKVNVYSLVDFLPEIQIVRLASHDTLYKR